jgi:hypothetical protein
VDSFPLATLAGDDLGRLLNGRIDSLPTTESNTLTFTPEAEPHADLSIQFRGSLATPFEIAGFPFLTDIARLLDDNWFVRPSFDSDVTGSLRRTNGRIAIDGLQLENKGRLAIRGSLAQGPDRRLSGTLQIGIAEAMLKSSQNPRLVRLFTSPDEHFRWVSVKISGTSATPADNFLSLYDATRGDTAQPGATPAPAETPSFEDLTQPD